MTGRLLTADDLAERWQVPKSHVYALTRCGTIPTVKLGRYYRYRLDAIEAFELGDGLAGPGAEPGAGTLGHPIERPGGAGTPRATAQGARTP
jgi:excisionase family DNA binding protein